MDVATRNLDAILNGDDYVLVESGVPLFDEHDEYDEEGKVVRRFGRSELQKIANQCNNRARETGDLAPWGPGHTKDDVENEDQQPPVRGYYANYRVGKYGPSGKVALLADCYAQKRVKLANGKVIDGREYAKGLPRRSVELWPNSMTIDWVAHLRRSPMRDLGLLTYSRKTGKIRYSMMESAMPNEITPADAPNTEPADDMPPEGHEDFVKHLDYAMKNHPKLGGMCKKYEAASSPTATNVAMPGAPGAEDEEKLKFGEESEEEKKKEDGELLRNMRAGTGDVRVSRYQKEIDDLKRRVQQSEHKEKMARYERDFREMESSEKIIFADLNDDLLQAAAMDEKQFEAFKARIRKNYQRDPSRELPNNMVSSDPAVGSDPLAQNADKIMKYARDNDFPTKYGANAFMEAAKALKFVKS